MLATPAMVAMDGACSLPCAGSRALPEELTTVGVDMQVSHVSASPVGMKVWAEAELMDTDGPIYLLRLRRLTKQALSERPCISVQVSKGEIHAKNAGQTAKISVYKHNFRPTAYALIRRMPLEDPSEQALAFSMPRDFLTFFPRQDIVTIIELFLILALL